MSLNCLSCISFVILHLSHCIFPIAFVILHLHMSHCICQIVFVTSQFVTSHLWHFICHIASFSHSIICHIAFVILYCICHNTGNCHGAICQGNICHGNICPYQQYFKASSGQGQGKVRAMSEQDQNKVRARSRKGQRKVIKAKSTATTIWWVLRQLKLT